MKKGCRQMVEGQAGGAVMRRMLMGGLVFAVALAAFGRGEPWVPPPPAPPPAATLTNAARYLEWKWRMDVTDPTTGVDAATARDRALRP